MDDELEPEIRIRCAGWMAVKDDIASVDILAHAVAESELDDGLAMEEPARRARLGRHPEKHHVFQFGKYRNERYEYVTEETPDYYFLGLVGTETKQVPSTLLGMGDRTLCRGSSAFNPHVQGNWTDPGSETVSVKGSEADRVATQEVIAPGRVEANSEMCLWCDPCHATRAGSNATHVRLTCLQCGTVTQTKREETLVKSPETCQHVNTDARGSSSATHRVYCRDCDQYVYECPQSEWRQEQNEILGNLLRGRTDRIDFSRGGERGTRAEESELIHSSPQALRLFLRQRPDEEFDLHQIEQDLQDCVDPIRETAEAGRASSSATLENTITAFVACAPVSMTSTSTFQGS